MQISSVKSNILGDPSNISHKSLIFARISIALQPPGLLPHLASHHSRHSNSPSSCPPPNLACHPTLLTTPPCLTVPAKAADQPRLPSLPFNPACQWRKLCKYWVSWERPAWSSSSCKGCAWICDGNVNFKSSTPPPQSYVQPEQLPQKYPAYPTNMLLSTDPSKSKYLMLHMENPMKTLHKCMM